MIFIFVLSPCGFFHLLQYDCLPGQALVLGHKCSSKEILIIIRIGHLAKLAVPAKSLRVEDFCPIANMTACLAKHVVNAALILFHC